MVAIRKRDGQPARSAQRRCQRGSTKRALMSRRQSHSAQHAGRKGFRKILHMLLIIGRQEKEKEQHKRTCLKKLSARLWNPAAWPPQIVVKEKPIPAQNHKVDQNRKETPNNDALCSTPEPAPQIFSHTAHEEAQISNISRQR